MKKLKKSQEMIDFITTATDKAFLEYIAVYPFKNTVEPYIYEHRSEEIVLAYLKRYGFAPSTRTRIFKDNKPALVNALLEWAEDSAMDIIFKEFMAHSNYKTIKAFEKTHECLKYPEQELFADNRKEQLLDWVKQHKISPYAKLRIIMEGGTSLLRTLIDTPFQSLSKREENAFFEHAKKEDVLYWIQQKVLKSRHLTWKQKYLIRFGTKQELINLITSRRLTKDAEEFFFRYDPYQLIKSYMTLHKPQKGEEYLMRYGKHDDVISYLMGPKVIRSGLSDLGEKLLLQRENHEEIMAFIDRHPFHDENEVAFLERGIEKEIRLYLRYHSLCDIAQITLLKSGNIEAISYFINHYPLADTAYVKMLRHPTLKHLLYPSIEEEE